MQKQAAAILALMMLATLFAWNAQAAVQGEDITLKPVQIFDVKAGKVVRTLPNDEEYQKMASSWLRSATKLSPKIKPDDKCGFVYRVPLDKPVSLKIGKTEFAVDDVFLFYCPENDPLLLVFDAAKKPYLLEFEADLKPFLRKVAAP
ncbi:hypothetical protein DNH61_23490 [Paenibacillus sambharensis]|uniref:Uncharacterized protein n=1 Tax=Paenibacillus sambharensis TaxID=1803190 RepID=A0A2W1LGK1_9BACL|nr:hypothetical protein [Paenibacillus sambharensis]PZD93584.1 hypothetical protein DNH61_23490 [Paenibacillus sambharensis]